MTLLSLIGHQAKVTNCIRSRFCKYKPGCGVSHNSNHRAAELVTRAIPQLSQETEHFCRSVNKSCEDCPVWGPTSIAGLRENTGASCSPALLSTSRTALRQLWCVEADADEHQIMEVIVG